MIIVIMGVSGSGKSTVGTALSKKLNLPFYDADDYHSPTNKEKMHKGIPLLDVERLPWLKVLCGIISKHVDQGKSMILACSALKESHRALLNSRRMCRFVYLKGTFEIIQARMAARSHHFFHPELLKDQFDSLEKPKHCLTIDVGQTVHEIVEIICKKFPLSPQEKII